LLQELSVRFAMGLILVTHDIGVAAEMADEVAVMYAGRLVERGPVDTVLGQPRHPYTQGLIRANVRPGQRTRLAAIVGQPPRLDRLPPGCAFAPRCPRAIDLCRQEPPADREIEPGHHARCIRAEEPVGASYQPSVLSSQVSVPVSPDG